MSRRTLAAVALAVPLAGCAMLDALPPSTGLVDVLERPAERALLAGMRAYDDGQYAESERQLELALRKGLASPADRAAAHKYLAFLYCSSQRTADCAAAFRAAKDADPSFRLSRAEAGHPLWGPVYRRLFP